VTAGTQEYRNHLLLDGHRAGLRLLEQLDQPRAALQLRLGRGVQVRSERSEGFQFAYCDRSRRRLPATSFIALICAAPPTRETETPTLIAGRTPWLNRSVSRKHCPSVIEMTFVGM